MTVTELADKTPFSRESIIRWIKADIIKASRRGMAPRSPYVIPMAEATRVISELTSHDV